MLRLQLLTIAALIFLGSVNLYTQPDTVTYTMALPTVEQKPFVYEVVGYDDHPNLVPVPVNFTAADQECLTKNIYHEAKNQSVRGQMAVAIVTLKRVADKRFPNTICGAVTHSRVKRQADGLPARHKCQFSWYCDGKSDRPQNHAAYENAKYIADMLLDPESSISDFTYGADHYHADYIDPPPWTTRMQRVAQIDNHIFYTTSL